MSRAILFLAGAAAFAGGFGITPQLPQPIDQKPVRYLAPSIPDGTAAIAATTVDRSRKGDRGTAVEHAGKAPVIAAVEVDGLTDPTIVYRDGIGRELFRADPSRKLTVVVKGIALPAITIRGGDHLLRKPAATPASPNGPAVSCDAAFRSPGDPAEANVPGRCFAGEAAMKLATATN